MPLQYQSALCKAWDKGLVCFLPIHWPLSYAIRPTLSSWQNRHVPGI
jgi:hypothetical protein